MLARRTFAAERQSWAEMRGRWREEEQAKQRRRETARELWMRERMDHAEEEIQWQADRRTHEEEKKQWQADHRAHEEEKQQWASERNLDPIFLWGPLVDSGRCTRYDTREYHATLDAIAVCGTAPSLTSDGRFRSHTCSGQITAHYIEGDSKCRPHWGPMEDKVDYTCFKLTHF